MSGGRPPKLGQKIAEDRAGNPIRVEDVVLQALRAGNYVEVAAAAAGIHRDTLRDWIRVGQRAPVVAAKEQRRLTPHESRCVAFSVAVARTVAEAEVYDIARIQEAGLEPSVKRVTVTREVPIAGEDGKVTIHKSVEVREEQLPPDWRALAWRRERRSSRRWGQRGALQVTGADGGPVQHEDVSVAAKSLLDEVAAYRQGLADGSIVIERSGG